MPVDDFQPPEQTPYVPAIYNHPNRHRRHHQRRGFRNIWDTPDDAPLPRVLGWLLSRAIKRKRNVPAPAVTPDLGLIRGQIEQPLLTWIGHSSFLFQTPSHNILFDPVFTGRASPLPLLGPRREAELPLGVHDLPSIDLVVLSHDHYDHLDRRAVEQLQERFAPTFYVPLGVGPIIRRFGAEDVVEMDWWQRADPGDLTIHCLPARHFSGRGLHNRNGTLWASWYLETADLRLYFAGDSGYASHFSDIARQIGPPDVALMPIGAYLPRWMMEPVHVSPPEALRAFRDVEAEVFVPTHWGTFDLADEPLHQPIEELIALAHSEGLTKRILRMAIGETVPLRAKGRAPQETSARSAVE